MPVDTLRGVGLSNQKTQYIRNIAQAAIDGIVPDSCKANRMSDDELVEQLTSIKGVGRWTVEMLLIFRLRPAGRPASDRLRRPKRIRLGQALGTPQAERNSSPPANAGPYTAPSPHGTFGAPPTPVN